MVIILEYFSDSLTAHVHDCSFVWEHEYAYKQNILNPDMPITVHTLKRSKAVVSVGESCFSLIGSSDFPFLVHCLACTQNKKEGHKIIPHVIINSFLAYSVTLHCFVFYLRLTHC